MSGRENDRISRARSPAYILTPLCAPPTIAAKSNCTIAAALIVVVVVIFIVVVVAAYRQKLAAPSAYSRSIARLLL